MATKSTTTYQVEMHEYAELTSCPTPEACSTKSHWTMDEQTYPTLARARHAVDNLYDTPANRIVKVTTTMEVVG